MRYYLLIAGIALAVFFMVAVVAEYHESGGGLRTTSQYVLKP